MKQRQVLYFGLFLTTFSLISKVVLVTGGAGFIGSHVSEKLLTRGDEVIIIDNLNDAYDPEIKKQHLKEIKEKDPNNKLTVYIADICDEQVIRNIFKTHKIETVCHLAARAGVRASIENPVEYMRTNILGTTIIFEQARIHKIKNIVFASSSSVYGERKDKKSFEETDCTDFQISPYGMSKKAGELLAATYWHLYKLPVTCLRFFTVYGPRARRDMAPYIFMNAIYHEQPLIIFGDGYTIRDFTYIDDIVNGILKAIDMPLGFEIINLGKEQPITLIEFIRNIEFIVGKKAFLVYENPIKGDVPFTYANITKAKKLLNYFSSIAINEGIQKMFEYYKKGY